MSVSERDFEEIYSRDSDPWGYGSSSYERTKYERTLGAIPEKVDSALELGCSIGVFTQMLAPRCEALIGVDFSSTAVAEAQLRTADSPQVQILRAALPAEMPAGRFDLIVCSELLYYWDREAVIEGLAAIEERLVPGGRVVVVGWRGDDPAAPLDARSVRELLREESSLGHVLSEEHPGYLLDAWARE